MLTPTMWTIETRPVFDGDVVVYDNPRLIIDGDEDTYPCNASVLLVL